PIIFSPCEVVDPAALKWLLDHGANPNCPKPGRGSALDYLIRTYVRSVDLPVCIELLIKAGATTKYLPVVFDLLRNRVDLLAQHLDGDASLIHRLFPDLDFGRTAARRLTLEGATLLHVAAEFGNTEAARLLLNRGTPVDITATAGQTALFHAVTQNDDFG